MSLNRFFSHLCTEDPALLFQKAFHRNNHKTREHGKNARSNRVGRFEHLDHQILLKKNESILLTKLILKTFYHLKIEFLQIAKQTH